MTLTLPSRVIDCLVMVLARLASDAVLDAAYGWLCHRRRDTPADADVWSFRRHWPGEKRRIQADLLGLRSSALVCSTVSP